MFTVKINKQFLNMNFIFDDVLLGNSSNAMRSNAPLKEDPKYID